jgi:ferredoxin
MAAAAIAQGRQAAEALHATLTSTVLLGTKSSNLETAPEVSVDFCPACAPVRVPERPVRERLSGTEIEVHETISEAQFLQEAGRCFSCGQCHGCQNCFMYCNVGSFTALERPSPGAYFALSLDRCMGCGKCIELCPTGYLSAADAFASPRLRASA